MAPNVAAQPAIQRPDPLELLAAQEAQRLPWLLPVRHSRMAQDPLAFFRGAAVVMAADLARQPHSGLMVQLCGDAHLLNFGFYGSPERQLLFDIVDFDETHPGPFEWDVLRLAASLVLAARALGLSEKQQSKICRRGARAYAEAMASFAAMPLLEMWVLKLPIEELIDPHPSANLRQHLEQVSTRALQRNSAHAVRKLCESDSNGTLRFRHEPPLIWRFDALPDAWIGGLNSQEWIASLYGSYFDSLSPVMQQLLSQFRLSDAALKAVGVGSVGTRCGLSLFVGPQPNEVLVLQGKQAEPSVLAPYVSREDVLRQNAPLQAPEHQGQRVVQGQRLMQTASDIFLGWGTNPLGQPIYLRQFRDWKGSVDLQQLDGDGLKDYGKLCGWTLAKAHARSGDRVAIAQRIGPPKRFANSLLEPALAHAEQAERDHQALLQAIAEGRIATAEVF